MKKSEKIIIENVTLRLGHDWEEWGFGAVNVIKKPVAPLVQSSCDEQAPASHFEKSDLVISS